MKTNVIKILTTRKRRIETQLKRVNARLKNAPNGTLSISRDNNKPVYYWNIMNNKKWEKHYLGKKDLFRVSQLAQKSYDGKYLRKAEEQLAVITEFLDRYDEYVLENIYSVLSDERKALVEAEELDDEEYARRWSAVTYDPGRFEPGSPEYYTLKGERVRSKSEKIIADTLFTKGIPYRYEYPLHLKDGQTWRPDFTILNVRTREEFYLEHLGLLDDQVYCANALGKIHIFMENGIFPGDRLLITAESSAKPFSTKDLDMLIEHFLK